MKVVTFFNNKGGVGKTTTIINLASYLSIYREKKVLVVDLDPQSNSTQAILPEEIWLEFYDPENRNTRKTIYAINEQIQNIAQKKDTLCRRMYN